MAIVPIDENDIAAARALRIEFARFWSTTQGAPEDVYDQFIALTPMASGVTTRPSSDDPGPGWWCEPVHAEAGRAILYIHGGGYFVGHAGPYRGFVSQIAARARVPVFALEYPLSTQAALPVALDLAVATLERLASRFTSVAVVGDSAGGGLSFATVLEAQRRNIPVSAIIAFSPWTDFTFSGASARDMAVGDPLLDPAYLRDCAARYLGSTQPTDPRASPLFSPDLKLLPPSLIQVGSDENLLDDSRRMAEAIASAGRQVEIEVWQGMHHVFPLNIQLISARRALDHAAAFLTRHWAK
jgi:acetyl esterase/lipase